MPTTATAFAEKSTNGRSEVRRSGTQLNAVRIGLRWTAKVSPRLASRWAEYLFTSPRRFARPAKEVAALAGGEPFFVEHEGLWLRGWRWGDDTSVGLDGIGGVVERPAVLLVHGWEGRGSQLGALIRPLVELGYQVVTFDAPGHGDSPGSRLDLPGYAEIIRSVATRVAPRLHAVIAHSFGAAATSLALHRGLPTRNVVYLAPAAMPENATERFAELLDLGRDVMRGMEQSFIDRTGLGFKDLAAPNLVKERTEPLLIIHDFTDKEVPLYEGEAIALHWPGARFSVTNGLGHRRLLWDELVVERVVKFVSEG